MSPLSPLLRGLFAATVCVLIIFAAYNLIPSKHDDFVSVQPYAQLAQVADVTSGLVGWWKLNDGSGTLAADSVGGNTGTLSGSPLPAWTSGKTGGALSFDGLTDTVNIGNPSVLNFGQGSFSYGMWVYVSSTAGSWDEAWWKGGSSASNPGYDMELGTSNWNANIADGTNISTVDFSSAPLLNQWVHLFVVVDRSAGTVSTYVNGARANSTALSTTFGSVSSTNAAALSGQYRFKGLMDDVRVYNRALAASEVAQIYNAAQGVSAPTVTVPNISNVSVSNITTSGATITWTTDQLSDSQVVYGLSAAYGSNSTLNSTLVTSHTVVLSGLSAGTTYNYQTISSDSAGTGRSANLTFTTVANTTTGTGQTYYMGITNCSDSGPGTSTSAPWCTLAKAVTTVKPGDTVLIMPGSYTGYHFGSLNGSAGNYITFKNYSSQKPVILGNDPYGEAFYADSAISYVILDGIEFANATGDYLIRLGGVNNVIIRNCIIHDSYRNGIFMYSGQYLTVDKNIFYNNGASNRGYALYATGRHSSFTNNIDYNSNWAGVQLAAYPHGPTGMDQIDDWTVANNVFYNILGGVGMYLWDGGNSGGTTPGGNVSNVRVYNNIFQGVSQVFYFYRDGTGDYMNQGIEFRNNIYPSSATLFVKGGPDINDNGGVVYTATNNTTPNPLFVDPANANFRLQSTSPGIDGGYTVPGLDHDIVGAVRPQGAAYDIGAYESGGTVTQVPPPPPPPTTYTITSSAGSGGTITPSGSVSVTSGGSQTFTITANSGYQVSAVTVDGSNAGAVNTYTFSNVTANHTVSATFTATTVSTPPSTTFSVGTQVQVYNTPSLSVRSSPSITASYVTGSPENTGAIGTVTAAPAGTVNGTSSGGYYWWYITYANGVVGWSAEIYLTKYTAATPAPVVSPVSFVAPSVALTSPTQGKVLKVGGTLNMSASATDPNGGSITSVQFYNGTTLLGTDTVGPYAFSWTNVPAGTYNLSAKATESEGPSNTSLMVKVSAIPLFTRTLQYGMIGADVQNLQIFLNTQGFIVSSSGPGSPGNETTYFGKATVKALTNYQNAHAAEILAPSGLTSGTGYFGPTTMQYVNNYLSQ